MKEVTKKLSFLFIIFIAGFSAGWLANHWQQPVDTLSTPTIAQSPDNNTPESVPTTNEAVNNELPADNTEPLTSRPDFSVRRNTEYKATATGGSIEALFMKLLAARRYEDAMLFYQEQELRDVQPIARLRAILLAQLEQLLRGQNHSDFSELIGLYLATYFDDIDILLLLAEFNRNAGAYIEAVNIYQLAITYAYTDSDQQKVLSQFNQFIERTDQFYSQTEDWFALGNFYSHIDNTGLLTARYQYRQAIITFNSGDRFSAIEQLRALTDDSQVGPQATETLEKLLGRNRQVARIDTNPNRAAEIIALQQRGNQYLVDVEINRSDPATLLIDTGASTTTLTRDAFNRLTTRRDIVVIGKRIFQTANGFTEGTIYRVSELSLGGYRLENAQIAVLDFGMSSGVDGLLGMNVLGQFRFQIDQENNNLLLDKI